MVAVPVSAILTSSAFINVSMTVALSVAVGAALAEIPAGQKVEALAAMVLLVSPLRRFAFNVAGTATPSGHTLHSDIARRRRKPSCRQPVACPTLRSGQPTGRPEQSDSDSRTGVATGGRSVKRLRSWNESREPRAERSVSMLMTVWLRR